MAANNLPSDFAAKIYAAIHPYIQPKQPTISKPGKYPVFINALGLPSISSPETVASALGKETQTNKHLTAMAAVNAALSSAKQHKALRDAGIQVPTDFSDDLSSYINAPKPRTTLGSPRSVAGVPIESDPVSLANYSWGGPSPSGGDDLGGVGTGGTQHYTPSVPVQHFNAVNNAVNMLARTDYKDLDKYVNELGNQEVTLGTALHDKQQAQHPSNFVKLMDYINRSGNAASDVFSGLAHDTTALFGKLGADTGQSNALHNPFRGVMGAMHGNATDNQFAKNLNLDPNSKLAQLGQLGAATALNPLNFVGLGTSTVAHLSEAALQRELNAIREYITPAMYAAAKRDLQYNLPKFNELLRQYKGMRVGAPEPPSLSVPTGGATGQGSTLINPETQAGLFPHPGLPTTPLVNKFLKPGEAGIRPTFGGMMKLPSTVRNLAEERALTEAGHNPLMPLGEVMHEPPTPTYTPAEPLYTTERAKELAKAGAGFSLKVGGKTFDQHMAQALLDFEKEFRAAAPKAGRNVGVRVGKKMINTHIPLPQSGAVGNLIEKGLGAKVGGAYGDLRKAFVPPGEQLNRIDPEIERMYHLDTNSKRLLENNSRIKFPKNIKKADVQQWLNTGSSSHPELNTYIKDIEDMGRTVPNDALRDFLPKGLKPEAGDTYRDMIRRYMETEPNHGTALTQLHNGLQDAQYIKGMGKELRSFAVNPADFARVPDARIPTNIPRILQDELKVRVHGKLQAMKFHPDVASALEKWFEINKNVYQNKFGLNKLDKTIGAAVQGVKKAQTIYNPGAQPRYLMGEAIQNILGGMTNPALYRAGFAAARAKVPVDFFKNRAGIETLGGKKVLNLPNHGSLTDQQLHAMSSRSGVLSTFTHEITDKPSPLLMGRKLEQLSEHRAGGMRTTYFAHALQRASEQNPHASLEEVERIAAKRTAGVHPTYYDMTPFEKRLMAKYVMPFYAFSRKNFPNVWRLTLERAGAAALPQNLYKGAQDATGQKNFPDELTPRFLADVGAKPIFSEGAYNSPAFLSMKNPTEDALIALNYADPRNMFKFGTGAAQLNPLAYAFNQLSPFIKDPIQVSQASTGAYGAPPQSNMARYIAQQFPLLNAIYRATSTGGPRGNSALPAILSYLSGTSIAPADPQREVNNLREVTNINKKRISKLETGSPTRKTGYKLYGVLPAPKPNASAGVPADYSWG